MRLSGNGRPAGLDNLGNRGAGEAASAGKMRFARKAMAISIKEGSGGERIAGAESSTPAFPGP